MKKLALQYIRLLPLLGALFAGSALGENTGTISGEGFVTSVNRMERTITVNGERYRISPKVKLHGFAKKWKNMPPLRKGDSIVFRLSTETPPIIVEIWNQQE